VPLVSLNPTGTTIYFTSHSYRSVLARDRIFVNASVRCLPQHGLPRDQFDGIGEGEPDPLRVLSVCYANLLNLVLDVRVNSLSLCGQVCILDTTTGQTMWVHVLCLEWPVRHSAFDTLRDGERQKRVKT
jgi:hypothetical protein